MNAEYSSQQYVSQKIKGYTTLHYFKQEDFAFLQLTLFLSIVYLNKKDKHMVIYILTRWQIRITFLS